MAWTYSDWITQTNATTRIERLRLHIKEVSDVMDSPDMSSGPGSVNFGTINSYYQSLLAKLAEFETSGVTGTTIGQTARWVKGRPV